MSIGTPVKAIWVEVGDYKKDRIRGREEDNQMSQRERENLKREK